MMDLPSQEHCNIFDNHYLGPKFLNGQSNHLDQKISGITASGLRVGD